MTEGQILERTPGAELVDIGVDAEKKALVTHAVHSLAIDSRLV